MRTNDPKEHLCDTCSRRYPECEDDAAEEGISLELHFGNGKGHDNIIECNFWDHKN